MKIKKKYHFYASHRNEMLQDKCFNLHGHTYYLEVVLDFKRDSDVTMLFSEIDAVIEPVVKGKFDHASIWSKNDPLYIELNNISEEFQKCKRKLVLPYATSVENMCMTFFHIFREKGLPVCEIVIKETTTSEISYTLEDYQEDNTYDLYRKGLYEITDLFCN